MDLEKNRPLPVILWKIAYFKHLRTFFELFGAYFWSVGYKFWGQTLWTCLQVLKLYQDLINSTLRGPAL